MLGRPARQLRAPADAGLGTNLGEVAVDRARGDVERRADLLVRAAVGDETKDVELAGRQLARAAAAALTRVATEALNEVGGERGADHRLAATDTQDGVDEIGAARALRHEARGAGRDRVDDRVWLLARGEKEHSRASELRV